MEGNERERGPTHLTTVLHPMTTLPSSIFCLNYRYFDEAKWNSRYTNVSALSGCRAKQNTTNIGRIVRGLGGMGCVLNVRYRVIQY